LFGYLDGEYNYEIVYKKGALNTNADVLSKISELTLKDKGHTKMTLVRKGRNRYCRNITTHRGMNRTYKAIKSNHSWTNMKHEIEDYVRQCKNCQMNKILSLRGKALVEITSSSQPFEKCCLGIVGPLTETQAGNKCILTFQHELSKFLVEIPIPREDAHTVAKEFVMHIILKLGTPKKILTDKGSKFLSEVFKNTCKMLKIKNYRRLLFALKVTGAWNEAMEY
jgi:hypothetical protein